VNGNPPDRFSVTPEPATAGQQVTICYQNEDRKNEHIEILLFNGIAPGQSGHQGESYTGYTDSNGLVCWSIYEFPDWLAHFVRAVDPADSADHPIPTA